MMFDLKKKKIPAQKNEIIKLIDRLFIFIWKKKKKNSKLISAPYYIEFVNIMKKHLREKLFLKFNYSD